MKKYINNALKAKLVTPNRQLPVEARVYELALVQNGFFEKR